MITVEQAQDEARNQAARSAREHKVPFSPWPEDYQNPTEIARSIPFLGDRKRIRPDSGPPMWIQRDVRNYIPDYPYIWFFVDSSGMGGAGEPALTLEQFVAHAQAYHKKASSQGYETGFGIVQAGQFQVHIAPYLRKLL